MSARLWSRILWGACALCIAGLIVWCIVLPDRTPPAYPEGDPAVIELYTWQASHGLWMYGPYSRFGWHHPGPLYFYLLAPFYSLGGHHPLALNAGAFATNLVTLTILAWVLARFASGPMATAVLFAFSWYLFQIAPLMASVWNPHVLLLPFAATIASAALVMTGRLWLLPVLVALGSFVIQTHAAFVPCVAAVCTCGLVGGLLRERERERERGRRAVGGAGGRWRLMWARGWSSTWKWLAASAVMLGLLWLPALVEQFTSPTGNLTAIAHFFGPSGPSEAGISFSDALAIWSDALTLPMHAEIALPYGRGIEIQPSRVLLALAAIEIILLAVAALAAWRSRIDSRDVDASLALLCAVGSQMALVAIARIRGGVMDHLVAWVTMLGVLNIGVLSGEAAAWIALTLSRKKIEPGAPTERRLPWNRVWPQVAPLASVALVLTVVWFGWTRVEWHRQELIRKSAEGRTPTQALYEELRIAMIRAGIRKPLIHAAAFSWPQAAGIALQWTKREHPFASDLVWLLGPQVTPHGDEDADVIVADTPTRHQLRDQPGDCMILERHGTWVHLRAVPPERLARVGCATN